MSEERGAVGSTCRLEVAGGDEAVEILRYPGRKEVFERYLNCAIKAGALLLWQCLTSPGKLTSIFLELIVPENLAQ